MGSITRNVVLGWSLPLLACAASGSAVAPNTPAAAPVGASADDGASLVARFLAVSGGGSRWDSVEAIQMDGTLSAGGLSGALSSVDDMKTCRSVSHYTLGPVQGADGYDGQQAWRQDPGGEVVALDAPDAREKAVTAAWLVCIGSSHAAKRAVTFSAVRRVDEAGRHWQVVDATPEGGRAITLWFDATTGLLGRTDERDGSDVETTRMDDYRDVDGARLSFHQVTNRTDATGQTDPRDRVEVKADRIAPTAMPDTQVFAMPAMTASARIVDASGVTHVPFDLVNNHIYADATIDGAKVRVLVDTGGANVLTPSAATRLGAKMEGKLAGRGVGEQQVDVAFAHVGEVRLGGAVLSKPVFYVMDLGDLPRVEGVQSDGLVGFEMFRRFRVTVDYEKHVLTLTDPAKFQPPSGAHVLPFELAQRIPIIQAKVDGMPVRLSVDTGSRASLTLNSPFVRQNDLVAHYNAVTEAVTGWGVGGPERAHPARAGTLLLGEAAVRDVAVDLFTGQKGADADPNISGNLGAGVLRRFTVSFDYDARKMYLVPNADFAKPDLYDRSGMWLIADGDALEIVAVTPGGPADKAGLREGDRIATFGGESIDRRSLSEWRARLRELPAGKHLAVRVAGASPPKTVDLVLADIIPPHR
ncbi:MAG TPA: aspartyl protease family protein [Polyangiaceae bacterium]